MPAILVELSLPGENPGAPLDIYNKGLPGNVFSISVENQTWQVKFVVNQESDSADFWFVIEDVHQRAVERSIDKSRVHFFSAETATAEDFFLVDGGVQDFLGQFGSIHTHQYLPWPNVRYSLPALGWMYHANHGGTLGSTLDLARSLWDGPPPEKGSKPFSVFCSTQALSPMHKVRIAFVERLMSDYSDYVDWFGNGVNPVEQKRFGIDPYRFHFALENKRQNNVISEKLFDTYLGYAVPIYWGAPNVTATYPQESLVEIDIYDYDGVRRIVDNIIETDPYTNYQPWLLKAREITLAENFVVRLARIAVSETIKLGLKNPVSETTTLRSRSTFVRSDSLRYKVAKKIYYSFFAPKSPN